MDARSRDSGHGPSARESNQIYNFKVFSSAAFSFIDLRICNSCVGYRGVITFGLFPYGNMCGVTT